MSAMTGDQPKAKRGRPAIISRDRIVAAALEIAVEQGGGAVNMTSVATRLGVAQPALYYHVSNANELLGLLAAELLSQLPQPSVRLRWDRWLEEFGWELFRLLQTHDVFGRVPYLSAHTPVPPQVTERALKVLTRAGFQAPDALLIFSQHIRMVVDVAFASYAHAEEAQSGRSAFRLLRDEAGAVDDREIPLLRGVLDQLAGLPDDLDGFAEGLFEWQLALEIAGLRSLLADAVGATPPA